MPNRDVKTIEHLVYYQYARIAAGKQRCQECSEGNKGVRNL